MRFRKVIRHPFAAGGAGVRVAGGVNAVVSANVHEGQGSGSEGMGTASSVSSRQRVRIVQRDGRTEVTEEYDHDDSVTEPKGE